MNLLEKLKGGDLRSIGRADAIVRQIRDDQGLFDQIFKGIFNEDPLVRMRSADVAEKVSKKYPQLIVKHRGEMLDNLDKFFQQEVKWHMALMVSYLDLSGGESEKVFTELSKWARGDESKIVRVNSMQALADISLKNGAIRRKTIALIKEQIATGIPSLTSRGNKLLPKLNEERTG